MLYAFLPLGKAKAILNVSSLANRIFSSFVPGGQMTEVPHFGLPATSACPFLQLALRPADCLDRRAGKPDPHHGRLHWLLYRRAHPFLVHPMYSVYFYYFSWCCYSSLRAMSFYPRVVGSSVGLPGIWVIFCDCGRREHDGHGPVFCSAFPPARCSIPCCAARPPKACSRRELPMNGCCATTRIGSRRRKRKPSPCQTGV